MAELLRDGAELRQSGAELRQDGAELRLDGAELRHGGAELRQCGAELRLRLVIPRSQMTLEDPCGVCNNSGRSIVASAITLEDQFWRLQ